MKKMSREMFEQILSKLTKDDVWTVQTLTEHGAAGGGYQLCRNEIDGLLSCNGFEPFPTENGSNDGVMWDYFTQVLKRWPRGKAPAFAYTPEQQQRAERRKAIRHARKWIERHDDFSLELADNIFFGWKSNVALTEENLKSMFEKFGYTDLDFTAADMLEYLNRGNNQRELVSRYL